MVPPLPCFLGSKPPPTPTTADSGSSFHRQRNRACGKITTLRTVAAAATACLAAATCPPMTEAGALFPAACGSSTVKTGARGTHGGGGGNRRGLQEYATRGCFVLCVTPTSACGEYSSDPTARWRRRQGGCTALKSASGRTRAGAVASQPRGGFVDQRGTLREQFGLRRSADGMGRGGGASPLECRAGMNDGGKPGRVRSRFRRVFDKIRGRVPPPAAAASQDSNTITYDKKEGGGIVDVLGLRAGGNTSTFNADAHCPTCRTPVPYRESNFVSKIFFSWVTPLMTRGNKKYLEEEDLWEFPENQRMHIVADAFEAAYSKETAADVRAAEDKEARNADERVSEGGQGREAPVVGEGIRRRHPLVPAVLDAALIRALWTLYKSQFLWAGVIRFINTSVQFLPAILVQRLLRLLESGIATGGAGAVRQAYLTCLMLFSVVSLKTAVENQYFYGLTNLGIGMRGALSTAVYRKSLRLAPSARQNSTAGEIVNLMQLDAGRLESLPSSVHTIWDSAFQMTGYTVLLFMCLGPCVLAGLGLMILLIPLNTFFFQRLSKYRMEMLKQTDLRVKLVNEMLQGIRAIKFYNWETPFKERVESVHDAELGILRRSTTLRSLLVSVLTTTPALVIVITLGLYSALGNPLTPSKVFTALTLFNQLRFPLYFFPVTIASLADSKVSVERLSRFLNAEEVTPYVQRVNGVPAGSKGGTGGNIYPDDVSISMKEGAFFWTDPETEVEGGKEEGGGEQELLLPGRTRQTVSPALHGCSLEIKKGELVAVVGTVGSGKSSLLSALLGDMKHVSGSVYAAGSLAYVPQTAWIPNDSVRNNILFGKPYEEEKYRTVIDVCRLERDLELLENGDMTEIGEQGINLSGGQKQRLSLARALYSDADLFLLDDPLSALDAEVGKQVFERCVRDALSGKTRVLVTNQLQFLPQVDRVVVMGDLPGAEGATIVDQGTYEELLGRGQDLSNILEEQTKPASSDTSEEIELPVDEQVQNGEGISLEHGSPSAHSTVTAGEHEEQHHKPLQHERTSPEHSLSGSDKVSQEAAEKSRVGDYWGGGSGSAVPEDMFSHKILEEGECGPVEVDDEDNKRAQPDEEATAERTGGGLMTTEERSKGAVEGRIYMEYLSAAGSKGVLAGIVALFLVSNFSIQLQQWVVSFWSSDPLYVRHPLRFYLAGVTTSAAVVGVFSHLRTVWAFHLGLRASKRLHGALLRRVLHAPVSFFDTTPVGRIVQRFSKDTDQVDQQLISQISMMINAGLGVLGAGGAIIVATPLFTVGMAPLSFVYLKVMNYFRQVARELKRLDSITRSPIYAHFGETLGGLSAIRAFGHANLFARTNERLVDNNLASYFALKVVDRWLSVRLELLGNFVVLSATLLSVLAASNGRLIAGLAGLSITNALSMTGLLTWGVRCFTETETMMNSVERVLHTSQETPQEPPHHVSRPRHPYYHQLAGLTGETLPASPREDTQLATCPDDRLLLTTGWPWEGRIELRDGVTMRYRPETDLVLKGVTLTIRPGEKIGIVGRTGSGKSSLMQVLFRMVDCEAGSVAIDGVDTKAIGLAALRSRLTIIPQEPVLFSGTLRENLDPFEAYSDDEVWDALEQASLSATVRRFSNGLLEPVAEYGESLSAGQRQLVCLARALLRKTRVLLLDEATSSVDYETDNVIQSTLRSAFRDCTVLTIAHRLNTIMDSDRILVMDNGRIAELDSPAALLEDPNSQFSQLLASERRQSSPSDVEEAVAHVDDHREFDAGVAVVGGGETALAYSEGDDGRSGEAGDASAPSQ